MEEIKQRNQKGAKQGPLSTDIGDDEADRSRPVVQTDVDRGIKKSQLPCRLGTSVCHAHLSSSCSSSPFFFLQILFVVQNPDVFKSPASDTYIVFGEAKVRSAFTPYLPSRR